MTNPDVARAEELEMLRTLSAHSVTRVIHHGELRKPVLQDLLEQAQRADSSFAHHHTERFGEMVVEMFGNHATMAIALISQIHALQEQIRRMREQADAETRIVLSGEEVRFIRELQGGSK